MAATIYVLCALTSALCAVLLTRGYLRTHSRLLLWSSICFVLLCANSVLLVADRLIWTGSDLSLARGLTNLAGLVALVLGLVWDTQ